MSDELLNAFAEVVAAHYSGEPPVEPLLLSRFGQTHKDLLQNLKAEYKTLGAAAEAAGPERVRIVGLKRGQEAFAPPHLAQDLDRQLRESANRASVNSSKFDSLPTSVKVAFCLRTAAGETVALQTQPPFKYEKLTPGGFIRPGFRVIADVHRKPGLLLKNASASDRDGLWSEFLAWVTAEGLDPAVFTSTRNTTALSRLLAAQEPDVLPRLNIPADIVDLLLKRP